MNIALTEELLGAEEEADLVEWVVADGATVAEGDVIARFETAKLLADLVAPTSGVISLVAEPGSLVNRGETIATIS